MKSLRAMALSVPFAVITQLAWAQGLPADTIAAADAALDSMGKNLQGFGGYTDAAITALLQAAGGQGVVTDFMKYSGSPAAAPTDLVGMHIQGQDPTRMQVSYFLSGVGAQYQTEQLDLIDPGNPAPGV